MADQAPGIAKTDRLRRAGFDFTAAGLSAACAIHCLALPVAAASIPMFAVLEEAEWIHWAFLAAAIPVSWFALSRPGASWILRMAAAAGLVTLLLGALAWPAPAWETPLTVIAGTMLAIVHLLNATGAHRTSAPSGSTAAAADAAASPNTGGS